MIVMKIPPQEWKDFWMDICYLSVFGDKKPKHMETLSYALVAKKDADTVCFTTVVEIDGETAYWQHGGMMEKYRKTVHAIPAYRAFIEWEKVHHKRITTRIDSKNIPMLKSALASGFLIRGTWTIRGQTYVELLNEFGGD